MRGKARAGVVQEALRKDVRLVPWLMNQLDAAAREDAEGEEGRLAASEEGSAREGSMRAAMSSGGSLRLGAGSPPKEGQGGGRAALGSSNDSSRRGNSSRRLVSVGREGSMRGGGGGREPSMRGRALGGSVIGSVKQSLQGGRNFVLSHVLRIVKSMLQDEVQGGEVKKILKSFPAWDVYDRLNYEAPIDPEEVLEEVRRALPNVLALASQASLSGGAPPSLGGEDSASGREAAAASVAVEPAFGRTVGTRKGVLAPEAGVGSQGHGGSEARPIGAGGTNAGAGALEPMKLSAILRTPEGLGAFQSFVQTSDKYDDDPIRFFELVLSYSQLYQQHAATVGLANGEGSVANGGAGDSMRNAKQRTQADLLRRQIVEQFIEPDGFYRCVM